MPEWSTFLWTRPGGAARPKDIRTSFIKNATRYLPSVRLNIATVRHHLIALFRHLDAEGSSIAYDVGEEAETAQELLVRRLRLNADSVVDLLAGHTTQTGERYGVAASEVTGRDHAGGMSAALTVKKWSHSRKIAEKSHRFFGMEESWDGSTANARQARQTALPPFTLTERVFARPEPGQDSLMALLKGLPMGQQAEGPGPDATSVFKELLAVARKEMPAALASLLGTPVMGDSRTTGSVAARMPLEPKPQHVLASPTPEALNLLRDTLCDPNAVFKTPTQASAVTLALENKYSLIVADATNSGKTVVVACTVRAGMQQGKTTILFVPLVGLMLQHYTNFVIKFGVNAQIWRGNHEAPVSWQGATRPDALSGHQTGRALPGLESATVTLHGKIKASAPPDLIIAQYDAADRPGLIDLITQLSQKDKIFAVAADEAHIGLTDGSYRPALFSFASNLMGKIKCPFIALSATLQQGSTSKMLVDMRLPPTSVKIVRSPLTAARPELSYAFLDNVEPSAVMLRRLVMRYLRPGTSDRAIIFVPSRPAARDISFLLGGQALVYTSLLSTHAIRTAVYKAWKEGTGPAGVALDQDLSVSERAGPEDQSEEDSQPWAPHPVATEERADSDEGYPRVRFDLGKQVMVATQGVFGVGMDFTEVRLVLILRRRTESAVNYAQETGRAGRDCKPAIGIVMTEASHSDRDTDAASEDEYFKGDWEAMRRIQQTAAPGKVVPIRRKPGNFRLVGEDLLRHNAGLSCRRLRLLQFLDGTTEGVVHPLALVTTDDDKKGSACVALGGQLCDVCHARHMLIR